MQQRLTHRFKLRSLKYSFVLGFVFLIGFSGCSNPTSENSEGTPKWVADSGFQTGTSSVVYNGAKTDQIAWYATKLNNVSFTIEFDCHATTLGDDGTSEFIFLLYGNKVTGSTSFWNQGLILNYKSNSSSASANIRTNGIYTGVQYLYSTTIPQIFDGTKSHHYKITFQNTSLSFSIDRVSIFSNSTVSQVKPDGYFGIANYWGNDDGFTVSNLAIN